MPSLNGNAVCSFAVHSLPRYSQSGFATELAKYTFAVLRFVVHRLPVAKLFFSHCGYKSLQLFTVGALAESHLCIYCIYYITPTLSLNSTLTLSLTEVITIIDR